MLENPALMIRKLKFLLPFACASSFLDPSSSNVAFSCHIGSGINLFSLFHVIFHQELQGFLLFFCLTSFLFSFLFPKLKQLSS